MVRLPPQLEGFAWEVTALIYISLVDRLLSLATCFGPRAKFGIDRCGDAGECSESCDGGGFEEHVERRVWKL